jgi:hypothetical protein
MDSLEKIKQIAQSALLANPLTYDGMEKALEQILELLNG